MSRIVIGQGLVQIEAETWGEWKQLIQEKRLRPQFNQDSLSYTCFAIDGQVIFTFVIWRGAVPAGHRVAQADNDSSKAEFEAAFKLFANLALSSPSTQGDPTYTVLAQAVVPALGKSMWAVWNGPLSQTILRVQEVWIRNVTGAAVTGVLDQLQVLRFSAFPTLPGTALDALAHDERDALPAAVRFATGAAIDPLSEVGPLCASTISSDEIQAGTLDGDYMDHVIDGHFPRYVASSRTKPITIRPGSGLHVKHTSAGTVGAFDVRVILTEG